MKLLLCLELIIVYMLFFFFHFFIKKKKKELKAFRFLFLFSLMNLEKLFRFAENLVEEFFF